MSPMFFTGNLVSFMLPLWVSLHACWSDRFSVICCANFKEGEGSWELKMKADAKMKLQDLKAVRQVAYSLTHHVAPSVCFLVLLILVQNSKINMVIIWLVSVQTCKYTILRWALWKWRWDMGKVVTQSKNIWLAFPAQRFCDGRPWLEFERYHCNFAGDKSDLEYGSFIQTLLLLFNFLFHLCQTFSYPHLRLSLHTGLEPGNLLPWHA